MAIDETIIPLPSREEMLAAELPVEWKGDRVTYRFATETDRDNFGKAEAAALRNR